MGRDTTTAYHHRLRAATAKTDSNTGSPRATWFESTAHATLPDCEEDLALHPSWPGGRYNIYSTLTQCGYSITYYQQTTWITFQGQYYLDYMSDVKYPHYMYIMLRKLLCLLASLSLSQPLSLSLTHTHLT